MNFFYLTSLINKKTKNFNNKQIHSPTFKNPKRKITMLPNKPTNIPFALGAHPNSTSETEDSSSPTSETNDGFNAINMNDNNQTSLLNSSCSCYICNIINQLDKNEYDTTHHTLPNTPIDSRQNAGFYIDEKLSSNKDIDMELACSPKPNDTQLYEYNKHDSDTDDELPVFTADAAQGTDNHNSFFNRGKTSAVNIHYETDSQTNNSLNCTLNPETVVTTEEANSLLSANSSAPCISDVDSIITNQSASAPSDVQTNNKYYPCNLCNHISRGLKHKEVHDNTHLKCPIETCPNRIMKRKTITFFINHMKDAHKNELRSLQNCCYNYVTRHISPSTDEAINNGYKLLSKYICFNMVDNKFTCCYLARDSAALKKHQAPHTQKRDWFCDLCNYKANHKSHLTLHKKNMHNMGQKHFLCHTCHESFTTNFLFKKHTHGLKCSLKHTDAPSDGKPLECYLCNVSYAKRSQLKLHMENAHPSSFYE